MKKITKRTSSKKNTRRNAPIQKGKNWKKDKIKSKEEILNCLDEFNKHQKQKDYGHRVQFQHWHKRNIRKLCDFIKSPFCYKQRFLPLYHCLSSSKPLQERQRLTLCKVVSVLLLFTEAEHNQIGICKADEMDCVTHESLIKMYQAVFGEEISKGRWTRAIKQLKMIDAIHIDAAYLAKEDQDNPENPTQIRSVAAMKVFNSSFFTMIGVNHLTDVLVSIKRSIEERLKKGLSNVWMSYKKHVVKRIPAIEPPFSAPIPDYYNESLIH
uniref:Uncharacterized protein n=2 Tax=Vibrionaceae TaxID=641 RepID=A0A0H3ZPV5_VIBSP|nr:hypothetical protein [Vibrio splendidus]AKN40582.1 hypothetical protein [Enterovibrio norvegicus]